MESFTMADLKVIERFTDNPIKVNWQDSVAVTIALDEITADQAAFLCDMALLCRGWNDKKGISRVAKMYGIETEAALS